MATVSLHAAPPALLKDINDVADTSGPNPSALCVAGSTVFFVGHDPVHGQELWKSDGTSAGTAMIKDIAPGDEPAGIAGMIAVGGTVYFTATDGVHGLELWKSDGTESGTVMVKDILPGSASGGPGLKLAIGGLVLFAANDGTNGVELWVSDGTDAGTSMVKDIMPGGSSIATFAPRVMGGALYFTANDGVHGPELWKSDGTETGTVLVKDVRPGDEVAPFPSGPFELLAVGSTLYFSHTEGVNGTELWKTDGTESGTVMVKDILPGSGSGGAGNKAEVGGLLFFSATTASLGLELWKTDGTEAGTVLVKDIVPGIGGSSIVSRAVAGNSYYFTANVAGIGTELWRSDGTEAGTVLVRDLTVGTGGSTFSSFAVVDGIVFFNFGNFTNGRELWRTDGTLAGTVQVRDIWPGSGSSSPTDPVVLGQTLYFSAITGNANSITPLSADLWQSDGSEAGTVAIKPLVTRTASSSAAARLVVGESVYLTANNGTHGLELWRTDGTSAGTVMVKDIFPGGSGSTPSLLVSAGSTVFFRADNGTNGIELWKTDGTDAGTVMVRDIVAGNGASAPRDLVVLDGMLYFVASSASPSVNSELWRSDGTVAGTVQVKDILPGTLSSSPLGLTVFGGKLYFSANDGVNGIELWQSDGTEAGTVMLKNISLTSNSIPSQFKVAGSNLFFIANDGVNGSELWKTDGTEAGTVMVKDINPLGSSNGNRLTAVGSTLYFTALDGTHGTELWKSDGTEAGTTLVKDLVPGSGSPSGITALVPAGGAVYFPANDGVSGAELWMTDGTDAGTVMVKDIRPGIGSSTPNNLIALGDAIHFSANDGVRGNELWMSDGTVEGTVLFKDFTDESGSSAPGDLMAIRNKVFVSATTPDLGREMWLYTVPVPEIAVTQASTELEDGNATPVTFGTIRIGRSKELTFTVSNMGDAPLKGISLTKGGPDADAFTVTASPAARVESLGTTTFTVRFNPTIEGPVSAALHLSSNDSDEPSFDIVISGTGRLPIPGVISMDLPPSTTLLVNETAGVVSIPIIRTVGTDDDVSFTATAVAGTAIAGRDFVLPVNPHILADGVSTLNLPVSILNPRHSHEENEVFTVVLGSPTGGASLGAVTSVTICIVDSKDTVAPEKPSISYPSKHGTVNLTRGQEIVVTGEARDNKGIARVEVSLNGGAFVDASLVNLGRSPVQFSCTVTPVEGQNTLLVRSTDTSGFVSPLEMRTFLVNSPLTVTVDPTQGTLSPSSFAGTTFREPGKTYSITATAMTTPEPGYVFTQWVVGGGNGQGVYTAQNIGVSQEALRENTLTFIHLGGLELTAEFVPNPFGVVAGSYHGLIRGVWGPAANGSIAVSLQPSGAFSGRITMDGEEFKMTGQLDTTGQASFGSSRNETLVLNRRGKPPIHVHFWIDLYEGARLAGVATQDDGTSAIMTSSIEGDRAVFNGTTRLVPSEYLGLDNATATYTTVMNLSANQPYLNLPPVDSPQGFSYATVTLSKSGNVLIAGVLSDDTPFAVSSTLTQTLAQTLTCPLFTLLYDDRGFLMSMLQFDASQHESDMVGFETVWSRPPGDGADYPQGWTEGLFMDCVAARYLVTQGQSVLPMFDGYLQPDDADSRGDALPSPDADGNAQLEFAAASLPALLKSLNVSANDSVTRVPSSDKSFSLSLSRHSGMISGSFTHPTLRTQPTFEGVMYQKGSAPGAYGFFQTKKAAASDPDHGFGSVTLSGKP